MHYPIPQFPLFRLFLSVFAEMLQVVEFILRQLEHANLLHGVDDDALLNVSFLLIRVELLKTLFNVRISLAVAH